MKTNRLARRIVKIHFVLLWVAVAAIAGLELTLGHTLANRIGQSYGTQTSASFVAAPNVSIADMMAAAGQ